jgi:hypothetical protein
MPEPTPGVGPTADPGSHNDGRGEAGRNPVAPGANEPTSSQPSDLATLEAANTQLKADAAASARQEQANRVALQQQQQAYASLQAQLASQAPEPVTDLPGISDHAKSLKKAMFDGDEAGIDDALKGVIAEASRAGAAEAQTNANAVATDQHRRAAVQGYFSPYVQQFNNAEDPITQRTLQLYAHLRDSGTMNWVPRDSVAIQVSPGYNEEVNLHILKEAHQMALIENPEAAPVKPEPEYLEASNRGGGGPRQAAQTANARQMLNAGEISTAIQYWDGDPAASEDDILKDYFDHFSPEIREARKRTGGPVSAVDLVAAGLMSRQ